MRFWQRYPVVSAPMPFQMALDEILFGRYRTNGRWDPTQGTEPLLRFYFSSEPWRTVGYSYPQKTLQLGGASKVCRRITGGGLVHHGEDLIFSLMLRREVDESFKSVRVSYWKIHEAVKAGFENLGLSTRFYRCDEKLPRGKDCFLFPIASDLAIKDKKIAGGAQKRSGHAMLHQESIQLPKKLRSKDPMKLVAAFSDGFKKVYETELEDISADPETFKAAETLAAEKYGDIAG